MLVAHWLRARESNSARKAYETSVNAPAQLAIIWSPPLESNRYDSRIRRMPIRRAWRGWSQAGDLHSPVSLTEAANRHLFLPGTDLVMPVERARRQHLTRTHTNPHTNPRTNLERRRPAIRRSSPKGRVGLEPTPPAAWSGLSDSNRCRQTGSLPSWPLDETRQAWSGRRHLKPLRRVGNPGGTPIRTHARISHRFSKS